MVDRSETAVSQSVLFAEETVTTTEEVPVSVHVVMSRKDGSPHPFVEAVYDSKEAAEEHKRHLANNSFQHAVVAWGVHERAVQSEFTEGDDAD